MGQGTSASENRAQRSPAFPVRTIRAAIAGMVLMLCAATYLTSVIGSELKSVMRSQVKVLTAAEQLEHHGEILELSIRSVVTYGDAAAAARYRSVHPKLRASLDELRGAIRLKANQAAASRIDRADTELTAIQQQALALASHGNLTAARAMIEDPHYRRLLNIHYSGIHEIERRARAYVASTDEKLEWYLRADLLLTILGFGMIVLGWLAVLKPARRWGEQLDYAREDAECAARQLEMREAELQALNRKLFDQARTDQLTKLQTRLKFNEDMERLWPLVERYDHRYCLVMCDIDHFARYNDMYGHVAGDEVLRRVADALSIACRDGDQIYRFGGEEFLLVIPNCTSDAGATAAERYRRTVEELGIPHPQSEHGVVTLSMGVARLERAQRLTVEQWIREADTALLAAKRAGRNRVSTDARERQLS